MSSGAARPDYGIDAPGVVRNLALASAACALVWASVALGLWSGVLEGELGGARIAFPLGAMVFWPALTCGGMALWMWWDSRVGKLHGRERLLDRIAWTGAEQVLDVGCGRGLMLVGAARRLTTGRATGVDIWQAEDLSGNRPESTLENARREGVAGRVEVRTADMRKLPFEDASFDVVVSCTAIHNVYDARERAGALREIARVLRPGGCAVLDDIRHGAQYARVLSEAGCEVRRVGSRIASLALTLFTFGALRPDTLVATKRRGATGAGPRTIEAAKP